MAALAQLPPGPGAAAPAEDDEDLVPLTIVESLARALSERFGEGMLQLALAFMDQLLLRADRAGAAEVEPWAFAALKALGAHQPACQAATVMALAQRQKQVLSKCLEKGMPRLVLAFMHHVLLRAVAVMPLWASLWAAAAEAAAAAAPVPADGATWGVPRAIVEDLARALPEGLGWSTPPLALKLWDHQLWYQGNYAAEVEPAAVDGLLALGARRLACKVQVDLNKPDGSGGFDQDRFEVSLLLLCCILGDCCAASRLGGAGFDFTRCHCKHARVLADSGLRLENEISGWRLKPARGRLMVAKNAVRQQFAAAARTATARLSALRDLLPDDGLLRHVAGFVPLWSAGNEGMRQEVWELIGHDPLGDLIHRFDPLLLMP